jgi:hypothetical protein
MSDAIFHAGEDLDGHDQTTDVVDKFVSHVMAQADLLVAYAKWDTADMDTVGKMANNLWSEAHYVRSRLDHDKEERIKERS